MQSLVALLLFFAPQAGAARPQLPPVDSCAKDKSFVAYRQKLRGATARKDVDGLLALTDDKVMLSFGEQSGKAAMRKMWDLDHPAKSEIWSELGEVLRLGCARSGPRAVAPSLAETIPDGFEIYDVMVAVRPGSPLRATPDAAAKPVASLNWDLLTLDGWDEKNDWLKVSLKDGQSGYVRSAEVRSPVDYRATFEKVRGQWRMTVFIAGD